MTKSRDILKDVSPDDCIIAVMGPTGAGKSNFIKVATGHSEATIGHNLKSFTAEIRTTRVRNPCNPSMNVVFVDTPGFDDTNKSDTEILKMIADWLEKTYRNQIKLAGIIYCHRISDNRMAGTPYKNLRMFGKLCGNIALQNVVLVTTMWDITNPVKAEAREKELEGKFWKPMLESGSSSHRFNGSADVAWDIVDTIIMKTRISSLLLQEEMVDLERRLNETEAGKTLYTTLQKLLSSQQEMVRQLREEAVLQNNEELARELNEQYQEIQKQLQQTFEQIQQMKIPFFRRVLLLFNFKSAKAHGLY